MAHPPGSDTLASPSRATGGQHRASGPRPANMIGGTLKCVLPPGIRLSMPSVVDGSDYRLRVCGAAVCEQVAFGCAEGDFWVTVLAARL